jgi:hypothetical protein
LSGLEFAPVARVTTSLRRIAVLVFAVPTLGLMGQGILYLTTTEFMPYHSAALGVAWTDVPDTQRTFLLGVIKAMGRGPSASRLPC